jgi:ABC-type phosphate/phosphonate transport system ATPase subunit
MIEAIEVLRGLESAYRPSDEIAEQIAGKNLIAIIGPFAVGKTTLIETVAATHPDFTEVVSFTTRPPRGSGDRYRFLDHTADSLSQLVEVVSDGSLVNFTVHPTTGYAYGTEPSDYRSLHCKRPKATSLIRCCRLLPSGRLS